MKRAALTLTLLLVSSPYAYSQEDGQRDMRSACLQELVFYPTCFPNDYANVLCGQEMSEEAVMKLSSRYKKYLKEGYNKGEAVILTTGKALNPRFDLYSECDKKSF